MAFEIFKNIIRNIVRKIPDTAAYQRALQGENFNRLLVIHTGGVLSP